MPITVSEWRLREIKSLYEGVKTAWRTTLDDAIKIGGLLIEQKESLKHREWGPWCKQHLPFSYSGATSYMRLYRHQEIVKKLTVSDLKSTLTELSRILAEPDPTPDREIKFTLSPEEGDEFDSLITDLMENVFRVKSPAEAIMGEAIMVALRFTYKHKELIDEDHTSDYLSAG